MSLFRLLISERVFKIGNSIKADLTRIKKQFPQLHWPSSFNVIDLKEHCVRRGIIQRDGSGALDVLLEKSLGMYISKDPQHRKSNEWEKMPLDSDLLQYAALDVHACRLIFEKTILISPIACVEFDTAPGTAVVLLAQEGGSPVAYGRIVDPQPSVYGSIRVNTPTRSRLLIEISEILAPAAAAILHRLPGQSSSRTKSGALTLGQLKEGAGDECVKIVAPISHLRFDERKSNVVCKLVQYRMMDFYTLFQACNEVTTIKDNVATSKSKFNLAAFKPLISDVKDSTSDIGQCGESESDIPEALLSDNENAVDLRMLEAFAEVDGKQNGTLVQKISQTIPNSKRDNG